jgi:L-fuconolactonase
VTAGPSGPSGPAPVLDAHHHLWDPGTRAYPWMSRPGLEALDRRYDLADLRVATQAAGVVGTVLVQTVSDEAETREFLATAAHSGGLVLGVIGWVDLCAADVAQRLCGLQSGPGGQHLVGVRHQVEDEPGVGWLSRPDVRQGIAAVAAAGLVYDLLVRPEQLPVAAELADALPHAPFVLDHGAKPPIGTADWARWAEAVADLSRRTNVSCKLSGLFTEVPAGAGLDDVTESAHHLLACFGPQRLLFGTDWPVSTLAAPYPEVVQRTRDLLQGLSPQDRQAVLGETAAKVYGLQLP